MGIAKGPFLVPAVVRQKVGRRAKAKRATNPPAHKRRKKWPLIKEGAKALGGTVGFISAVILLVGQVQALLNPPETPVPTLLERLDMRIADVQGGLDDGRYGNDTRASVQQNLTKATEARNEADSAWAAGNEGEARGKINLAYDHLANIPAGHYGDASSTPFFAIVLLVTLAAGGLGLAIWGLLGFRRAWSAPPQSNPPG